MCTIFCHASFGMFHASIVHVVGVTQASFHQWILVNGSKGACSPRVKRLSPPSQTSESAGSRKPIDTSTKIKPFWGLKSLGNDPFRPRPRAPTRAVRAGRTVVCFNFSCCISTVTSSSAWCHHWPRTPGVSPWCAPAVAVHLQSSGWHRLTHWMIKHCGRVLGPTFAAAGRLEEER